MNTGRITQLTEGKQFASPLAELSSKIQGYDKMEEECATLRNENTHLVNELERVRAENERLRKALRWALPWAEDAVKQADEGYGHQEFKREAREDLREAREALEAKP